MTRQERDDRFSEGRRKGDVPDREILSSLVALIPDAVLIVDTDGRIVFANSTSEEIFGYRREDLEGRGVDALLPQRFREAHSGRRRRYFEHARPRAMGSGMDLTALHCDGHEFRVDVQLVPLETRRGLLVAAFVRDVTEQKKAEEARTALEEQLRHSQKMQAVGQLAGGVAHDFNNLLTTVLGHTDLLLQHLGEQDPLHRHAAEVRKAGMRAAALTRQLLVFSHRQVLRPEILDVNRVVTEAATLLRPLVGESIYLVFDLDPAPGLVRADPGQLEQILLNLAANARDAMPEGGTITIGTAGTGEHVSISVADTGCGIGPEIRARIFEPFFTTKEPGKGTGLGLSTVYGIVRQGGGSIRVESELGRGTVFEICLPRLETEAAQAEGGEDVCRRGGAGKETLEGSGTGQGSETVLVAEDDESLRRLVCETLSGQGYTVLRAPDGREALEAARRFSGEIQLLLTDVVMPEMGGLGLATRLADFRPETKVLYMSGYADDAVASAGPPPPGTALLHKPFTPGTLLAKVREVLSKPGIFPTINSSIP